MASPRAKPETAGPRFDPLAEPDAAVDQEEVERDVLAPEDRPARTDVIPRGDIAELRRRGREEGLTTRSRRVRPAARRVNRTLRHVDPITVLKLSLIFYACFLVISLVVVAILYSWLAGMGLFDAMEDFARGSVLLARGESLGITLWVVERWAFLIGLTLGLVASLFNVFLALLYNVAADFVGGVEMTFVERDL